MSFLNSNNSEYLSARITNRGRKAIANGNFNIQYFQIGDSEYDYTTPFTNLTGTTGHQKVFAPFDYDAGVKYPFGLDSTISTTYGTPISNNKTVALRNVMGTAGFVSQYDKFGASTKSLLPKTGTTFTETYSGGTIETTIGTIPYSGLTGTNQITFTKTSAIDNINQTGYVTLVFETFLTGYTLDNQDNKVIKNYIPTGKTNSFVYRYSGATSTTGTTQTITLDRNVPNLASISELVGNLKIITNEYHIESPTEDVFNPIDYTGQLNSWTLNTIWSNPPIGGKDDDETLTGYTSNEYVSIKNLLGYTKTGQTFGNDVREKIQFNEPIFTGLTYTGFSSTNVGTGFANSFNELIEVLPSEQRCVAIVHYSELGDISVDPERFFKYDDYISHKTGTTGLDISIVEDYDSENILRDFSDSEYFEVYIPFINYHRKDYTNTGTTLGALFTMDTTDYFVYSSINSRNQLKFRFLLDETGFIVGKVFVNNKIIVFDDQELVAMLDYRSNRRYTLPSPKLGLTYNDGVSSQSMLSTTGQTAWVTYMFKNTTDNKMNSLPCNYFNKISSNGTPSQITMKFNTGNTFSNSNMEFVLSGVTNGFVADEFYALVQINTGQTPSNTSWKIVNLTSQIPTTNGSNSPYIRPSNLVGNSFTINYSDYNTGSTFDLEIHMTGVTTNYLGTSGATDYNVTIPQFGDEQPFPGSVRLIRATDIEEMNMLINLPSGTFGDIPNNENGFSQNPTHPITGTTPTYITEVALLDSNKEPLVVAKTPTPVKRAGTQVFAIRLDF
jgi:hypothetical protein